MQPAKLSFLFSSIKHVFCHFSPRARCEICSKLTIKTPEYVNDEVKNKDTIDVVLASLLLTLSTFHFLLQPSKHSSWSWHTEDVFKMSWRRPQCNIFLPSKTSYKHVLTTSWRRLEDVLGRRIANTSWRRLGRRKVFVDDVFKTSSRRLGKQETFVGSVSIVDFDRSIDGWDCCLLFWRFVPAGINFDKVSVYGETR